MNARQTNHTHTPESVHSLTVTHTTVRLQGWIVCQVDVCVCVWVYVEGCGDSLALPSINGVVSKDSRALRYALESLVVSLR